MPVVLALPQFFAREMNPILFLNLSSKILRPGWQTIQLTAIVLYCFSIIILLFPDSASARGQKAGFWELWGDGKAEMAVFDLKTPRYGELRKGSATLITVTETFLEKEKVKGSGSSSSAGNLPVMKFAQIRDYQTGVYDYNLMSTSFIALQARGGRPSGAPIKISFGAQEWCGHVYHQLLFDDQQVESELHSYFEGEADQEKSFSAPVEAVAEDSLIFHSRGLSRKFSDGEDITILGSLETARLKHQPLKVLKAKVKIGEKDGARIHSYSYDSSWLNVFTEKEWPHKVLGWEKSNGEKATLKSTVRKKYWEMNKNSFGPLS